MIFLITTDLHFFDFPGSRANATTKNDPFNGHSNVFISIDDDYSWCIVYDKYPK